MKAFDYMRPSTLEEACAVLAGAEWRRFGSGGGHRPAGADETGEAAAQGAGQPQRHPRPELRASGGRRQLGYRRRHDALALVETSLEVKMQFPAVAEAAAWIGSVQVRSRATVGGNLCNAAPSADMAPILVALGAVATITDGHVERTVPLEEFFVGPGQTVLRPGRVAHIHHRAAPAARRLRAYERAYRSGMDSHRCRGGLVSFTAGSTAVHDARIVLGAVAPDAHARAGVARKC